MSPEHANLFLVKIDGEIHLGYEVDPSPAPGNDEAEWRKKITTDLRDGLGIIFYDEIAGTLDSKALASALTTVQWRDRLLGKNQNLYLPQYATWAVAQNNIVVGGDLARRCYWIKLYVVTARPWERTFEIGDALAWSRKNRAPLLAALLVLARAWWADDCPEPSMPVKEMGGFTPWAKTVAGILENVGVRGFLTNQEEFYETVDEGMGDWQAFLIAWKETIGSRQVTLGQLRGDLLFEGHESFRDALPKDFAERLGTRGFGEALAAKLRSMKDRPIGQNPTLFLRGVRDTHAKQWLWSVE